MIPLQTREEYDKIRERQNHYIIYKHSPACLESAKAYKHIQQCEDLIDVYILDVLDTGDLKYVIANDLEIQHESPQAIIFKNGKVLTYAHHQSISVGRIKQYILGWNDKRK